ncbi:hypothetical protein G6F31_021790 [Rhizopus arrhizus]|nr:hypothetical protein G6F31_021790 [Rhizopus arrhizus]
MRRTRHRQYRLWLPGRDGGLRNDRPVCHQREVRRSRPLVVLCCWRDPSDHGCVPGAVGKADTHGGAGRRHDHGVDRYL